MGLFRTLIGSAAIALADMRAAAAGAGASLGRALKGEHSPPPQATDKSMIRTRGWRRLTWAESKRKYGLTRSWTGQMNRDNPPGTKLARKAEKHALTINRIR